MGSFQLQQAMGLRDLRLSATMNLGGATACATIQHAVQAIAAGLCRTVACVFSDAPLKPPAPRGERTSSGSAYGFARGWEQAYGFFGVNAMYALVARRHMHRYGTTQDHLGAVAVAQRRWANLNPQAQLHDQPLTLEEYHRSRWIVEPFHLFDCCLVSNGGLAVIVTAADRARDRRRPPVYVQGMGQGHLGGDPNDTLTSGAVLAREPAFRMADIQLADVDVVELRDRLARGLRLLSEGGGRALRRRARHRPGWSTGGQHRGRPAVELLHVGHDAGLRGGDPAARRRRPPAGPQARRRARLRKRRRPLDPLDAAPVASSELTPA
jgi:acetyl-CoA acetyltransferase